MRLHIRDNWLKTWLRLLFCTFLIHIPTIANADLDRIRVAYFNIAEADKAISILNPDYSALGISATFHRFPSQRSIILVNSGEYDAELIRVPIVEANFPNLVRIPTPILETSFWVVAAKPENSAIESWEDLRGENFGYPLGLKILHARAKEINSGLAVQSVDALHSMLSNGRIDYLVLPTREIGRYRISTAKSAISRKPLETIQLFHYLNRKHSHLITRLDQKIREAVRGSPQPEKTIKSLDN
ncbi:MAG: hypothetical protein ABJY83_04905 [Roseibium sp.]